VPRGYCRAAGSEGHLPHSLDMSTLPTPAKLGAGAAGRGPRDSSPFDAAVHPSRPGAREPGRKEEAGPEVDEVGLGRVVALHRRSSALCQIR
jgi:hypothetical protein